MKKLKPEKILLIVGGIWLLAILVIALLAFLYTPEAVDSGNLTEEEIQWLLDKAWKWW